MRKLASIQFISALEQIEGADQIEKATVLGWELVVAKKDNFKVGDRVVYCEIDSVLPEKPEFEFLRARSFRIRTIKLKGTYSQGICFPMNILPIGKYHIGDDVTEVLGIVQYEPKENNPGKAKVSLKKQTKFKRACVSFVKKHFPEWAVKWIGKQFPSFFNLKTKSYWPPFLQKTDEDRIQIKGGLLQKHEGKPVYITEKLDGSSFTCYWYKGKFGVCSRNLELADSEGCKYWGAAKALGLEQKLKAYGKDIALQGELIGEGIQGNKYKLKGHTIRFFNVFDIPNHKLYGFADCFQALFDLQLESVPVLGNLATDVENLHTDIPKWVEYSKGKSLLNNQTIREGIVVRLMENSHHSFKVINPDFLLKHDE